MVSFGVILVNFPQQAFNDALYSLEEAKKLDKTSTPFEYWKYCTWSMISSMISMESYLTDYIQIIKDDVGKSFCKPYENESITISKAKGIYSKIRFIELITDTRIIDDNDSEWQNISNSITLRNDLMHYRNAGIFNVINDSNASNAIKACSDMIKKFHISLDLDYRESASWIDKKHSEKYD